MKKLITVVNKDNLLDILKSNGDLNDVRLCNVTELSLDKDKQYIIELEGDIYQIDNQAQTLASTILKDLPKGSYVFMRKGHYINIEEGRFANISFTIDKNNKVVDSEGREYFSNIPLAIAEILNILPVEGKYRMMLIKES